MVKRSVVDYVRDLIQRGHNIGAIRATMLKSGYSNKEIDEAVSEAYNPTVRHEIHLSHTTVLVIIFVVVSLIGAGSFFYYHESDKAQQNAPAKLLDVNLEPIRTTAEAGDTISFTKELSNLGSSKRYDVIIKHELILGSKVITQKIETRAIETFGSTPTNLLVPKDAKPGDYTIKTTVDYDGKKAIATLPAKILASSRMETCFDGLQNQNEEGIDCGGVCKTCEAQAAECDDNNPCTTDLFENSACMYRLIKPCCGNGICEEPEDCDSDCMKVGDSSVSTITTQTLEDIKEIARIDPNRAETECNRIEVPDLKDTCIGNIGEVQNNRNYCNQIINARIRDLCYSNVGKNTNDNSLCAQISADSRRDTCYMGFVLDNKDYTVCDKITNKQLRQSCESLRQLNELNSQIPQDPESAESGS